MTASKGVRKRIGKHANVAEHFFAIAKWAMKRGGTFSGQELHERFGICRSTSYRYAKAWRDTFGSKGPTLKNDEPLPPPVPVPSPTKVDLSRLLE